MRHFPHLDRKIPLLSFGYQSKQLPTVLMSFAKQSGFTAHLDAYGCMHPFGIPYRGNIGWAFPILGTRVAVYYSVCNTSLKPSQIDSDSL
jgi:hypothetical protein